MPSNPYAINDLQTPNDFDRDSYEDVRTRLAPLQNTHFEPWIEYTGAWIALSYRFKACAEYSESFTESFLNYGASPSDEKERYHQERDLYGFFVSGYSAIESFCYGLFFIASMLDTVKYPIQTKFPVQTEEHRKDISPESTEKKFRAAFSGQDITKALDRSVNDVKYQEWKDRRNMLAHRVKPQRLMSIGSSTAGKPNATYGPVRWGEIHLDKDTTDSRRQWLAKTLRDLLSAADAFTARYF